MSIRCKFCKQDKGKFFPVNFHNQEVAQEYADMTWLCECCYYVVFTIAQQIAREKIQKAQDTIDNMWKEKYCNE